MVHEEEFHAKTLKGLEDLLESELRTLGAGRTEKVNRGVNFYGGRALLYRVNLASRLALRVLLPVMRFEAGDRDALYRNVKKYDWSLHLDNKMTFTIDPVVHSPRFNNSQFVAQKVKDAIVDQFRERTHLRPSVDRRNPDLFINVHISGTRVTISLDSSGESLHKRGYREGNFEAPLNEVLAAGMIMISGWNGDRPFLDPMCGSGTLATEAALIAAGIPPGIFRKSFGFDRWKDFDRGLFEHVASGLRTEKEVKVPILARDADPAAVAMTARQLKRASLDGQVKVERMDFASSPAMEGVTIIMNPPYGERMVAGDLD
ncbi:MAG: RNA methyltransferase, partial [Bacteroidetes bacterium]